MRPEKDDMIKKIEDALRDAGIEIVIAGCGCCGSPWIEGDKEEITFDDVRIDSTQKETK
jgi:Fe-S oxidoreductase